VTRMRLKAQTDPGSDQKPNEDWYHAAENLVIVLDGATVRTDTGCTHGLLWFVRQLGDALRSGLAADESRDLSVALHAAIGHVAGLHPECDLDHPGTPSAAVGIVRVVGDVLQYLVLGDITVVLDTDEGLRVIVDDHVSHTAQPYRGIAQRLPFDAPERPEALLAMKRGELAARNTEGGYWIASTLPAAAEHALIGQARLNEVHRAAVLSDGAAAYVALLGLGDWQDAMGLLGSGGPRALIERIRDAQREDPQGNRWPRMKAADDATVVFADLVVSGEV
jgi:hypothetical protein